MQDGTQRLLESRLITKRERRPGAPRAFLLFGRPGVAECADYRLHTSPGLEFFATFFFKKKSRIENFGKKKILQSIIDLQ